MCLFYFGGFPRNPVKAYERIVCQLSGGERIKSIKGWGGHTFFKVKKFNMTPPPPYS